MKVKATADKKGNIRISFTGECIVSNFTLAHDGTKDGQSTSFTLMPLHIEDNFTCREGDKGYWQLTEIVHEAFLNCDKLKMEATVTFKV